MWVWVLHGVVGGPREVGRHIGHWGNEFGTTPGYLGTTAGVTDDRRLLLLVRWESEAAANDLLVRPEHVAWWTEFQKHFAGDYEFADTDEVTTFLAGGSDSAGFVQAMRVTGVDRPHVEAADREFEKVAPSLRPDLMGSLRVWTAPDTFVEANYFTSEKDAREGEQHEPPAEVAAAFEDFMTMTKDAEFFDLTEPFLHSPTGR